MSLTGLCPNCADLIIFSGDVESSEILICPVCLSELIVEVDEDENLILQYAPDIEEYWTE